MAKDKVTKDVMEHVQGLKPHVPYVVFIRAHGHAFSNLRREAKNLDPNSEGNVDEKVLVVSMHGDELTEWANKKGSGIKAIQAFRLYQKEEIGVWKSRHMKDKKPKLRSTLRRMHSQNKDSQEPR